MNTKLNFKQIITAGLIAAAVSAILNAILFYIFHSMGVISDSVFIQPEQNLTIVPVLISSVLPTLVGASVFYLFEKYSKNGYKTFSILSIILMSLSFASPFLAVKGMPIDYGIVLNIMHVTVCLNLLIFIKRAYK